MLWHCKYTWFPGTTQEKVRERLLEVDAAHGERLRKILKGWYSLVGGGAGYLLIDTDDALEVGTVILPYMDLMSFDVHAIFERPYDQLIAAAQKARGG
ncbi:MAG: DUF3303 domain-containing protein [Chloroflexi bacterium]|nr:DUF3303 domain-containing protein [Chloroflexota bacterium]